MRSFTILVAAACLFLSAALSARAQDEGGRPKKNKEAGKGPDPLRLLERLDKNNDGFLQRDELPERLQQRFERIDADGDGKISRDELSRIAPLLGKGPFAQPGAGDPLFRLLDADNDGKLSKGELQNAVKLLQKLDRDKDGMLDRDELGIPKKGAGGRPGEVNTPAAKGERHKDTLKADDLAPDFTLPLVNGKDKVMLSSFKGKKPVVLIFASYT